jgi:hypothetical protein
MLALARMAYIWRNAAGCFGQRRLLRVNAVRTTRIKMRDDVLSAARSARNINAIANAMTQLATRLDICHVLGSDGPIIPITHR